MRQRREHGMVIPSIVGVSRIGHAEEPAGAVIASPWFPAGMVAELEHVLGRAMPAGVLLRSRQEPATGVEEYVNLSSDPLHFLGADLDEVRIV